MQQATITTITATTIKTTAITVWEMLMVLEKCDGWGRGWNNEKVRRGVGGWERGEWKKWGEGKPKRIGCEVQKRILCNQVKRKKEWKNQLQLTMKFNLLLSNKNDGIVCLQRVHTKFWNEIKFIENDWERVCEANAKRYLIQFIYSHTKVAHVCKYPETKS